jgi:hypothetical protein
LIVLKLNGAIVPFSRQSIRFGPSPDCFFSYGSDTARANGMFDTFCRTASLQCHIIN